MYKVQLKAIVQEIFEILAKDKVYNPNNSCIYCVVLFSGSIPQIRINLCI